MRPDPRFVHRPMGFWANVRTLGQELGYTERGTGQVCAHDLHTIVGGLGDLGLGSSHVQGADGRPTPLGVSLLEYFAYRANILIEHVEPRLMDAKRAEAAFKSVRRDTKSTLPIPMNKQRGDKKRPAYLTAIIAMLIDANAGGVQCDYDPHELTTFTRHGAPLRTLARRVDGAFPGPVNPVAVWEIKEYYYTTTFGSRVADGVYESLLDGMELQELRREEGVDCKHYLMVDAHYAWWGCGRSYLCRIVDMLHMGYVDEVLFGSEVLERLPDLTRQWVAAYHRRENA